MASQGTHLPGVRLIYIIIYAATFVGDWWLPAGINDIHCKLNPGPLACTASALITELISCAHACTCAMGLSNQFVYLSISQSVYLPICQSVSQSSDSQLVCLSVCLSCRKCWNQCIYWVKHAVAVHNNNMTIYKIKTKQQQKNCMWTSFLFNITILIQSTTLIQWYV